MSHTPGPWRYEPTNDGSDMVYGSNGEQICKVHQGEPGDPNLIIAAPDLLAALRALIKHREDMSSWQDGDAAHAAGLAAIAKAEGHA